jgi:hypothetical protein
MLDINKFSAANFSPRSIDVPVPEMERFFPEDTGKKDMTWEVRGLTAEELAGVNDAVQQNKNASSILSAISSKVTKEKIGAIKEAMGMSDDNAPDDVVRRITMLTLGCVSPECPQDMAVRVGDAFPQVFYKLSNKITELTGLGKVGE